MGIDKFMNLKSLDVSFNKVSIFRELDNGAKEYPVP